ncbi:NAD(P)-binding protein [Eremomyces bilateralis CBS 781.70]|uniref:NAD(P)-binding protein n=1 Tax=Eremomyces bilateralis CBS 781.70 TaxID=1392243 RepID=A0A6G1GC39_9PEZI|nr:NAD(P)-binding protein [Eremomyces bilateralis CBS 781.70]KAF1815603.1 NAD(P)-binding protein [Eremomyces bilateralis CBS 781.70]
MPVAAVAGGTGKLGRAIVDGINAAGKFEVVILARQADDEKAEEIGARIIAVDYSSPDAIASVLEGNSVEVVISALSSQSPPEQELNLLKGADQSLVTKRYIPSIWGIRYTEEIASYFPPAAIKLSYIKALESTSIEWTAVINGYFLDYYGAPKVKTYMPSMALVVDLDSNFAAIPGSGDVPVVFTHTFDVGKFVAALLTKDIWEKESYIIGDRVTLNEFVRFAEEVKKTKFTVEHDSIEKLKTGQITELPSHPPFYPFFPKQMLQGMFAAFGIMFENGVFDLKPSRTLNDDFPDIKPMTIRELILEAYGA